MELQHFSHEHPLVFIQEQSIASEEEEEKALCFGCGKLINGSSYCCNDCKFYLHKNCAELEILAPEISHPFHPKHLLTLLPKSPYNGDPCRCDFCDRKIRGFVYHCFSCEFDLDINCALLQTSVAKNIPNFLHHHTLIFVQNHKEEVEYVCSACKKPLAGPIYHCLVCPKFCLHKECGELNLEINHPYDRIHPLTLLVNPPIHPQKCRCYLCKIKWKGFVYCCSVCNIELTLEDVLAPTTITVASHDHPWTLLPSQVSFICDFCGTTGDRTPYFCTTCSLIVHMKCISLPSNITITRHHHAISHSYSLHHQQNHQSNQNWKCRICRKNNVDARYGGYYCYSSDCNYIAHVNCATDNDIWDGKSKDGALLEPMNLITVIREISIGDQNTVAAEIKHAYHDHNLVLVFTGELIQDDDNCDGCMGSISTPFYSCGQCKFFLHKNCVELPRKKQDPFHKHLLTLTEAKDDLQICTACDRHYHGFSYECLEEGCSFGRINIRCSLIPDTLNHPGHEHPLCLDHKYRGMCSGCLQKIERLAYICEKRCGDFALDLQCVTLPLTAWYKYDRHRLSLTYFDDSDPCQLYCDLCENERNPNHWFYYCADCDNSLHTNCAIGDLPLVKLGSKLGRPHQHPHPLTFVKHVRNCPRCNFCGELCRGQALECKESECNFSIHWRCPLAMI